ncbi:4'-phosphopantetheinyl transferase family protein [Loktanella sp. R86503]|uniref:4'-phosphopantetheinyl transferase family protein n=1 Tax=Loktanella sp. R86503 TaxID=3093847 RepID=UPI0036DE22D7
MTVWIDIWVWDLVNPDPAVLSRDETARAARFVFNRDRDRYIAGRSRLRRILSSYLNQNPRDVTFCYGDHGRPDVHGLQFNLSHTGDLACLAVSRSAHQLGLDIEAVRPIDLAVARAHFAPEEMAALVSLPDNDRVAAFYRCWTRKEAYLKARGTGLSTDLASFTVTITPQNDPELTFCESGDAAAWILLDLNVAPGIAGALAVRSGGEDVRTALRTAP